MNPASASGHYRYKRHRRSSLTPYNEIVAVVKPTSQEMPVSSMSFWWPAAASTEKKTWTAICCHVIPHGQLTVKMNSKFDSVVWKMNISRQQLELLNVDFGQLLSWSNPCHLCLHCVHLEYVAAHPRFNFLRAADKPSDSCPRIPGIQYVQYIPSTYDINYSSIMRPTDHGPSCTAGPEEESGRNPGSRPNTLGAVHKVCHAPRGEGVWESVIAVCDRGGGKDCVTSHFQFFHNSSFYVLFYILSYIIQI